MDVPIGPLKLNITLIRHRERTPRWEELAATGMDDLDLARLNQRNTRDYEGAPWAGLRLIYGGRRP